MHDLVDIHRANISRAGVALAEAIAAATAEYTASVAASEAALDVAMEKRVAAFHGIQAALAEVLPVKPEPVASPQERQILEPFPKVVTDGPESRV